MHIRPKERRNWAKTLWKKVSKLRQFSLNDFARIEEKKFLAQCAMRSPTKLQLMLECEKTQNFGTHTILGPVQIDKRKMTQKGLDLAWKNALSIWKKVIFAPFCIPLPN